MKTNRVRIVVAALILAAIPVTANAQPRISVRLVFGVPPVISFYASLATSYGVPYQDIYGMHEAGVVDEDIPVILYIHAHSQYSLRQIYSLRLRGATWENLSNWCGVPLYRDRSGPPYGNAYGHDRRGPDKQWKGERGKDRFQEDR